MDEHACPARILFDGGIAFSLGLTLGTMYNTYKGYRRAPNMRIRNIHHAVFSGAPRLGGKLINQHDKENIFLKQ